MSQSKAAPFFGAAQTRQSDVAVAGDLTKNVFNSFAGTPQSAIAALAITVAGERAEDIGPNGRSQQFPGLQVP